MRSGSNLTKSATSCCFFKHLLSLAFIDSVNFCIILLSWSRVIYSLRKGISPVDLYSIQTVSFINNTDNISLQVISVDSLFITTLAVITHLNHSKAKKKRCVLSIQYYLRSLIILLIVIAVNMMNAMVIFAEFFVVILKVLWAFVTAGAKWVVRPKEKSVAGQVCVITGAGSGLGRLFAKEFARRRAVLVLWDINSQSNEETAELVREIYRELDSESPMSKEGELPEEKKKLSSDSFFATRFFCCCCSLCLMKYCLVRRVTLGVKS